MQDEATVTELVLLDQLPAAKIACKPALIPAPGQYLLAHADQSDSPVATAIFATQILDDGLIAAPPVSRVWRPGTRLHVRGPLGHGFVLPRAARRVALIACDNEPRRLLSLVAAAPTGPAGRLFQTICPKIPYAQRHSETISTFGVTAE